MNTGITTHTTQHVPDNIYSCVVVRIIVQNIAHDFQIPSNKLIIPNRYGSVFFINRDGYILF